MSSHARYLGGKRGRPLNLRCAFVMYSSVGALRQHGNLVAIFVGILSHIPPRSTMGSKRGGRLISAASSPSPYSSMPSAALVARSRRCLALSSDSRFDFAMRRLMNVVGTIIIAMSPAKMNGSPMLIRNGAYACEWRRHLIAVVDNGDDR